jgi:hypothetical protein
MPCVVYYNMQLCPTVSEVGDIDDSEECDYSMPPLTTCRLRKLNMPPVTPSIGVVAPEVCGHIKPPIRMDYCRVIFVLCSTLGLMGVAWMYYNQLVSIADMSLHTPNQPLGDLLIVSFRLQVQGVTNGAILKPGDILIPIESLRSTEKQNFSFHILSQ